MADVFTDLEDNPTPEQEAAVKPSSVLDALKKAKKPEERSQSTLDILKSQIERQAQSAKKNKSAKPGKEIQEDYPLTKPKAGTFARVHPDENYSLSGIQVLKNPDDANDLYMLSSNLDIDSLPERVVPFIVTVDLYAACDHLGNFFVWPVKQSDHKSSAVLSRLARKARGKWLGIRWNKKLSNYNSFVPEDELDAPDWKSCPTWAEMIESAFEGHVIEDEDHPIINNACGRKSREAGDDDDE